MNGKTIHQLKNEVLFAYMNLRMPGLSMEGKEKWIKKYEKSRSELEKCILTELN